MTTFRGVAAEYARYRPGYPPEFFDLLHDAFHLDGTGVLLDLGCGTGQILIPLAPSFEQAIGLDPEPEMLAEAQRRAGAAGITNVRWVTGRAEDLPSLGSNLDSLRLATLGRSFHWMDRAATLRHLADLIVPGGGLVIASDRLGSSLLTDSAPESWRTVLRAIIETYAENPRRAGRQDQEPHRPLLERSPFRRIAEHRLPVERRWTVDSLLGHLRTTSFCSPQALGARSADFAADLRTRLGPLEPPDGFHEVSTLHILLAWQEP